MSKGRRRELSLWLTFAAAVVQDCGTAASHVGAHRSIAAAAAAGDGFQKQN